MKKFWLILAILFLPSIGLAQSAWRVNVAVIEDVKAPVGAFVYEDALYLGNLGSGPDKADGFILRYNLEDSAEDKFLDNKLYDPKGFTIVRNRLLLIDQNLDGTGQPGLMLADIKRDKIIAVVPVAGAGRLQDITALNSSTFVITDKQNNKLFHVIADATSLTVTDMVLDISEASGVCLLDGFIFVAGSILDEKTQQTKSGSLYQIDPFTTVTQRFVTLTHTAVGYLNALDGSKGYLFVTDWSGQEQESAHIFVINVGSRRRVAKIEVPQGVSDIAVYNETLYAPVPGQNRVLKIDMDFDSLGR